MGVYKKAEDLINIGAYISGSNTDIDYAINIINRINGYLRQGIQEKAELGESISHLERLFGKT